MVTNSKRKIHKTAMILPKKNEYFQVNRAQKLFLKIESRLKSKQTKYETNSITLPSKMSMYLAMDAQNFL